MRHSVIVGSCPALVFKLRGNKLFPPHSLVNIQYSGEPGDRQSNTIIVFLSFYNSNSSDVVTP